MGPSALYAYLGPDWKMGGLLQLYRDCPARPERSEYAPFGVWLSYAYLPAVLKTQLKLPTRHAQYFVSESSVYRILKAADLITNPAYTLLWASDAFKDSTTRVHEMWQTYFRIIHWGRYYLSTVLDDF